jgi:hypothetical protein
MPTQNNSTPVLPLTTPKSEANRLALLSGASYAAIFVFGIVMALLGAILPSLASRLRFGPSDIGALFLVMNAANAGVQPGPRAGDGPLRHEAGPVTWLRAGGAVASDGFPRRGVFRPASRRTAPGDRRRSLEWRVQYADLGSA